MENKNHLELLSSYNRVSENFENNLSFDEKKLQTSKEIFHIDLEANKAIPKELEVIALLGGLTFSEEFQNVVHSVQNQIKKIIGSKLNYMVKKENLGVELLVLKWPWDRRNLDLEKKVIGFIDNLNLNSIKIDFDGIQIHDDGCLVVRGFDCENQFINLRNKIVRKISQIPSKQSNWVHVPIGRILDPLSKKTCKNLKVLIDSTRKNKNYFPSQNLGSLKMVHESQWYMEKRSIIKVWHFN